MTTKAPELSTQMWNLLVELRDKELAGQPAPAAGRHRPRTAQALARRNLVYRADDRSWRLTTVGRNLLAEHR